MPDNRSFSNKMQDFGLALSGDNRALQNVQFQRSREEDRKRQEAQGRQQRTQQLSGDRKRIAAQDFRDIGIAIDSGQIDQAKTRINDRLRVGSMLPDFDAVSSQHVKDLLDAGDIKGASEFLNFSDQVAVSGGFLQTAPQRELTKIGQNDRLVDPNTLEVVVESSPRPDKPANGQTSGTFQAKDKNGNLFNVASIFDPSTNTTVPSITGLSGVDKPVGGISMIDSSGRTAEERVSESGLSAASQESAKAAIRASEASFQQLGGIDQSLALFDDAVKLIDDGADTGPIYSRLPSFRASAIALDNIRSQLGLEVISGATFGALSEGEMNLALNTALPTDLPPPELKLWIQNKQSAQRKMGSYLRESAIFLGTPGNSIPKWLDYQKQRDIMGAAGDGPPDTGNNLVLEFDSNGNQI